MDFLDQGTHKELLAKLDYLPPACSACAGRMVKYDFQKTSKIPYLEVAGFKTLIKLKKRRFKCKDCRKMRGTETDLVKKNHHIPVILNQKIAQKLIEKLSMTAIAEQLSVATSTVFRNLKEFQFKTDLNFLPALMSWDGFSFKKGRMSFVAQDFESGKILAILDGRTQATNNLIKVIKRYAFGFRNFDNFRTRIFIALNIKKEKTRFVLSRC